MAKEEMVEIPQSQLASILEQLKTLQSQVNRVESKEPRELDSDFHTARFKTFDGKACIGYNEEKGIWTERSTKGEELMYLELILRDGDDVKKSKMLYRDFINANNYEVVQIVSIEDNEKKEKFGSTTITSVEDFRTVDTRIRIPLVVKTPHPIATVKFSDGKEMEVKAKFLNMC